MTAQITAHTNRSLETARLSSTAAIQVAAAAIAFWPVWAWYCERTLDRSDEPLGIVALITVLALAWERRWQLPFNLLNGQTQNDRFVESERRDNKTGGRFSQLLTIEPMPRLLMPMILVLLYCGCLCQHAPLTVLSIIAVAALSTCLPRREATFLLPGDCVLLMLSLPVVASLNFYFGYPLRLLATNLASLMLHVGGLAVSTHGAAIFWNGTDVSIDQPCNGIKMLWVALYLTATLASLHRLKPLPSVQIMFLAVISAVSANAARVSSLFYLESGIIKLPNPWHSIAHTGIGIVMFAVTALILVKLTLTVARPDTSVDRHLSSSNAQQRESQSWLVAFMLTCALAAVLPILQKGEPQSSDLQGFNGWPAQFEGCMLRQEQLSPETARFADEFPGRIAVFRAEKRRVVFRWVTQPTRQLHSSESCYRASGYEIKWLPEYKDSGGNLWSAFEADRGAEKLLVRERLFDQSGQSWTDVSAWYWSAVLQKSKAPWWSVCVAERIDTDTR